MTQKEINLQLELLKEKLKIKSVPKIITKQIEIRIAKLEAIKK